MINDLSLYNRVMLSRCRHRLCSPGIHPLTVAVAVVSFVPVPHLCVRNTVGHNYGHIVNSVCVCVYIGPLLLWFCCVASYALAAAHADGMTASRFRKPPFFVSFSSKLYSNCCEFVADALRCWKKNLRKHRHQ